MKQWRSKIAITCEWCHGEALVERKGKSTVRFCSPSCANKYVNSLPHVKLAKSRRPSKPKKSIHCEWCGAEFWVQPCSHKRFCNSSCAALWRWRVARKKGTRLAGTSAP